MFKYTQLLIIKDFQHSLNFAQWTLAVFHNFVLHCFSSALANECVYR